MKCSIKLALSCQERYFERAFKFSHFWSCVGGNFNLFDGMYKVVHKNKIERYVRHNCWYLVYTILDVMMHNIWLGQKLILLEWLYTQLC